MQTCGRRVIVSFGAMKTIFSYLTTLKKLKLQALNKFMYNSGVSRVQVKLKFTLPYIVFYPAPTGIRHIYVLSFPGRKVFQRAVSELSGMRND